MCGRYTYYSSEDLINAYNFIKKDDAQTKLALEIKDNFNVSPGNNMPVITRGKLENQLEMMTWGLVPAWSKEPHTKLKLINARVEGLFNKSIWKRLINSKRCIVPARGFYEWKVEKGIKQPYYITPSVGNFFNFAGLYDEWSDNKDNELKTYTIITTNPNKEMAGIHNRMPAILNQKQMDLWLSTIELSEEQIRDMIFYPPDNIVQIVPVSTKVNDAHHNTQDLIYPLKD